jgi:hypothetical protein
MSDPKFHRGRPSPRIVGVVHRRQPFCAEGFGLLRDLYIANALAKSRIGVASLTPVLSFIQRAQAFVR